MSADRQDRSKRIATGKVPASAQVSILMLGVYFLTGMLLVLGQLLPGGTQQVASGESLPQLLLWLLVGALLATDHVLSRFGSVQERLLAGRIASTQSSAVRWSIGFGVGLLVWVGLSACNVYGHGNLRFALNGGWQWIAWGVSIMVLSRMMAHPRIQQNIQWLMIALAWLVAMHGFYQVFVSLPADRARFRENPQAVLREAGIDAPPGSSTYLLFEQRLQDDSPTGPFALTNSLAGFLVPWILVLFARAFRSDVGTGNRGVRRLLGVSVAACLCVCLLWTKSRTGWIALGVGGIAIVMANTAVLRSAFRTWQGLWFGEVREPHSTLEENEVDRIGRRLRSHGPSNLTGLQLQIMLMVGVLATIAVIALRWWDPKLFDEAGRSLAFRSEYWRTTFRIVADYPWLGVGPGNFQSYYAIFKPVLESETIADPHNFLLETLATAGWPALLLLIGSLIALIKPFVTRGVLKPIDEPSSSGIAELGRVCDDGAGGPRSWVLALLVGAIVGALAIWLSSGALGPSPDLTPYLLTIPVVIAGWAVCFTEAARARETPGQETLTAIGYGPALLGVGVHLLASGGWMTPGIGNTIAVLVAGLWVSGNRKAVDKTATQSEVQRNLPALSFGVLLIAWLLVVAFYITAWLPRQRSQQVETDRLKAGQIDEKLAIAMVVADVWNPTGYRWLADVRLSQVQRETMNRSKEVPLSLAKFQETAQAYLAKDRVNWETWAQLGHWELALSPTHKESLSRALDYYRESAQRAPGDVGLLVQAALAAWLVEDHSAGQDFLSRAEFIESNVTHEDRKLSRAVLYWPASVGPASTRVAPSVWQPARETRDLPLDWVRAEPVFRFLRSQLTPNQVRHIR